MASIKMTVGQALVRFLDNQYVSFDGCESKFVEGVFTIFGHGIVCGFGEALARGGHSLRVYQGKNEQGMAHAAASFAKQNNRRKIIACSSSIGPGAANMITAAAMATVNCLPLLLLPGDTYATRQPDPVLQQVEQPADLTITTNDAYKAVVKYWDRVSRPEQLMTAMINAMRTLTDPANCGAVCVSLPQDVQGEAFDYPDYFFEKRVWLVPRTPSDASAIEAAADVIASSKKPLVIVGGGARYSEAGDAIKAFCVKYNVPVAETQAGKSTLEGSFEYNLGGVGATGNLSANMIAEKADTVICVGTRFSDFTTGSKEIFRNPDVRFISINTSTFHAHKLDSAAVVGDAKTCLSALDSALGCRGWKSAYTTETADAKAAWTAEYDRLGSIEYGADYQPEVKARDERSIPEFVKATGGVITQTAALAMILDRIEPDAVAVGASGSLPGDMQRMWTTDSRGGYNMEYGYSTMGYEIAGALGSKLAAPDRPVYAFTGDGSFLMLHSEFVTSLQEGKKITVLLFDNDGFGCINNLQMNMGIRSFATEFRARAEDGELSGGLFNIDYAKVAEGYGAVSYTAKTPDELAAAFEEAKKQTRSVLIDIKTLPKSMTDGYLSWWNVGACSIPFTEAGEKAYAETVKRRGDARKY